MTPSEYGSWRQELAQAFADEQVAAGNWLPDGAFQRAWDEDSGKLPQGLDTPGMLLLKGVLPDGTPVGRAWIGLEHPRGTPDCAFIYDIEVEQEYRGRGLGRALMQAVEEAVAAYGVGALALNVFGENAPAVSLYTSAGYRVVTQHMRKDLGRAAD